MTGSTDKVLFNNETEKEKVTLTSIQQTTC